MVHGDDGAAVAGHQLLHDGVHVGIAVLAQHLLKHGKTRVHIAEVDAQDAAVRAEFPDIRHQVAEGVPRLQPAAHAQLDPQGGAAAGQPDGPAVALRVVDEAGDARHAGQGRVVGVEGHAHPGLLRHRDHVFQKILEIGPDLLLGEGPVLGVGAGHNLLLVAVHGRAAPGVLPHPPAGAQDAVGLPRDGGEGDARPAEHPEHVVEFLDVLVPAGQAQVDGLVFLKGLAQGVGHGDAVFGQPLLGVGHGLVGQLLGLEHEGDILDSHLPDKGQAAVALGGGDWNLGAHGHGKCLLVHIVPPRPYGQGG